MINLAEALCSISSRSSRDRRERGVTFLKFGKCYKANLTQFETSLLDASVAAVPSMPALRLSSLVLSG